MLGIDQVQQVHLKQKELRIKENSQPISYYPLKLETTGGSSYSIARRTCPPRSLRSSQISLKKHKPSKVSNNLDYSCIDSTYDQKRYQLIRKRLEFCLDLAGRKHLMCSMNLPCNLLNKISQDVLRMTKSEPSGLNGCIIHLELKERDVVHHLGQIGFDTQTTPTMELRLRLRRDYGAPDAEAALSARFQKFVSSVISPKSGAAGGKKKRTQSIEISLGFQLVKEKSSPASRSLSLANSSARSIASAPGAVADVIVDECSNDSNCSNNSNCSSNNSNCSADSDDSRMSRFSEDSPRSGVSSRASSRGRR